MSFEDNSAALMKRCMFSVKFHFNHLFFPDFGVFYFLSLLNRVRRNDVCTYWKI